MDGSALLPSLSLMTIGVVLLILVGSFAWFLRKGRNRRAAARAHGIDETKV